MKLFSDFVKYLNETFNQNIGENTMGYIRNQGNDTFTLVNNDGEVVGTYTRARDARRGAKRRGLQVAN